MSRELEHLLAEILEAPREPDARLVAHTQRLARAELRATTPRAVTTELIRLVAAALPAVCLTHLRRVPRRVIHDSILNTGLSLVG